MLALLAFLAVLFIAELAALFKSSLLSEASSDGALLPLGTRRATNTQISITKQVTDLRASHGDSEHVILHRQVGASLPHALLYRGWLPLGQRLDGNAVLMVASLVSCSCAS